MQLSRKHAVGCHGSHDGDDLRPGSVIYNSVAFLIERCYVNSPDTLQRFMFEGNAIRGELVHLDASFQAIRDNHDYPAPVKRLLGEALAAASLLSASIKSHESLILQWRGTGPVHMVVAQCSSDYSLRGLGRWRATVEEGDLPDLCGEGHIVMTIDPGKGRERYQGIVALTGRSLAESLEYYFDQSEQLPTRFWLACDGEAAAGMILQRLPGDAEDSDAWNRVNRLAATLTSRELLALSVQEVRHRLFHEEDVRVFDPHRTTFRCTCTRGTVERVLRSLGRAELEDILAQEGRITVDCEFCNRRYTVDAVDAERLLRAEAEIVMPSTRH